MSRLIYEGKVEGFTKKFVVKNLWRIDRVHEYEDAMQEAYIIFMKVNRMYGSTYSHNSHLMGIYKISLQNWLFNFSVRSSKKKKETLMCDSSHDASTLIKRLEEYSGSQHNTNLGPLYCALSDSSSELLQVLNLLSNAPAEFLTVTRSFWKKSGKTRFGTDRSFSSILGKNFAMRKEIDSCLKNE